MQITLYNFGRYTACVTTLADKTRPNGFGKTTLINAYVWALTGKTLNGFTPRRIDADESEATSIELDGFADIPTIRRDLTGSGTVLYIGGTVLTQAGFEALCADRGISLDLAVACADVLTLTSPTLTSEDLRRLLIRAGAMEGDRVQALRKSIQALRAKRKNAETFAITNVVVPTRKTEDLTLSEAAFIRDFERAETIADKVFSTVCPTCKRTHDAVTVAAKRVEYNNAKLKVNDKENLKEYKRLTEKAELVKLETQNINEAERLVKNAQNARKDLIKIDVEIADIEKQMREMEANAIRAELPTGVELVTEETAKNGNVKSVCQLTWNGIPLKSVNFAKRVEICVRLLDDARKRQGEAQMHLPIIIDNAESIQGLDDVPNVVRFCVG